MANVRSYIYTQGAWSPEAPAFSQLVPTASDQRLVASSTCARFASFASTVTHVYWHSDPNGGDFIVRFSGSAPSATCGHRYNAGDRDLWSVTMAACAAFISTGCTAASIFATPMW